MPAVKKTLSVDRKNGEICSHIRKKWLIETPEERVRQEFLGYYLSVRQDELLRLVKWSTTVQSINKEEMESVQIPVPPIEVQKSLAQAMERSCAEIARERETAEKKSLEIKAEIEELILGTKRIDV